MKTWHTSLDRPQPDHRISWRLFGFVLASVALHSVILAAPRTPQELRPVNHTTLQVTLGRLVPAEEADEMKGAKPVQTPRVPVVPVPRRQTVSVPSHQAQHAVAATQAATKQRQPETLADSRQPLFPAPNNAPPANSKAEQASTQQQRSSLNQRLQQALAKHFHYPMLARKRGWQGVVRLAFTLDTNGLITNARVAQSSGYRALDRAALKSLHQVAGINKQLTQALSFELPVIYSLSGG